MDPGVGSVRRPIAVCAGDWFFVGPDNGLFSYILATQTIYEAVVLSNPAYHLPQVSKTFQGRDIFAPVAAHLARGIALRDFGVPLDSFSLRLLDLKHASRQEGRIEGHIVYIDHLGNPITNIPASMVPDFFNCAAVQLTFSSHEMIITERRCFFADNSTRDELAARPFIYVDSADYIGVAIQNGNAAATLGVRVGDAVALVLSTD